MSTIKTELLSLSQDTKEGQYIKHLLDKLSIKLDNHQIQIHCNNRQSIHLMTAEIAQLQMKLQHINIHNHGLRQEVKDGQITVEYISTKQIIANGLTKALSKTKFNKFLRQVNLVNIASKIINREAKENEQEELSHNTLSTYMRDLE